MNEQLMMLLQALFSGKGMGQGGAFGKQTPFSGPTWAGGNLERPGAFGGGGGLQQLLGGLHGGSTGALRAPATAGMGLPWRPVPFAGAGMGPTAQPMGMGGQGQQMGGALPAMVANLFGRDTGFGTPAGGMPMMGQF